MTRKKRTYTDEFKGDAIILWQTSNKSAAAVENELDITHGLLTRDFSAAAPDEKWTADNGQQQTHSSRHLYC